MKFTKMEGLANDFILTVPRGKEEADRLRAQATVLCDRRRGVGADGLIFVLPPTGEDADFSMRIINADGSEAEMCGNGIRCLARYVHESGLSAKGELAIQTGAGLIRTWRTNTAVRVAMGAPVFDPPSVPVDSPHERVVDHPLDVEGRTFKVTALSMGNPHAVIHVPRITDELLLRYAPALERHPAFPNRVNVEFIEVIDETAIRMRVFERGCGETAACGTGACAAMVAGVITGRNGKRITVHLNGGDLLVEWDGDPAHSVFMTGPARTVFHGEVPIGK